MISAPSLSVSNLCRLGKFECVLQALFCISDANQRGHFAILLYDGVGSRNNWRTTWGVTFRKVIGPSFPERIHKWCLYPWACVWFRGNNLSWPRWRRSRRKLTRTGVRQSIIMYSAIRCLLWVFCSSSIEGQECLCFLWYSCTCKGKFIFGEWWESMIIFVGLFLVFVRIRFCFSRVITDCDNRGCQWLYT